MAKDKTAAPKAPETPEARAARPGTPKEAAAAFATVEAEAMALGPDALARVTLDVPRAVAIAVAAAPHIAELRPEVERQLPLFPLRAIDGLHTYALAAWYAHLLALPTTSARDLPTLLEEATPLRETLLVAAEALAHRRLFDGKAVAAIRAGQGNLDKANDLVALAALFSAGWPVVEQKTAVELAEVERAAALGPEILVALGERDMPMGQNAADAVADRRQRAFTLFVNAYDECRRAVSFLRWHEGDLDAIAPSLYALRHTSPAADPAPVVAPPAAPPA